MTWADVRFRPIADVQSLRDLRSVNEDTLPYRITAYTEWEILDVEAACLDDENAKDKARRYCSLKHLGTNFPPVIFSHVVALEPTGEREVGTWEYRLKGKEKPSFIWHDGSWSTRPDPTDRLTLREWVISR